MLSLPISLTDLQIDEVLRYMGTPPDRAEPTIRKLAEECAQELLGVARPRWAARTFELTLEEVGVRLSSGLLLPGEDLKRHLAGCRRAVLFCATLGVVLPSFFIILLIAALIHDLLKYAGVEAFLSGVRPCVVALILSTAFTMGLSTLLGISTAAETPSPAWRGIGILAILAGVRLIWQKVRNKAPSPIGMILLSAVLGALLYQ